MAVLDKDCPWEWNYESSGKTNATIRYNIYNYIGKKLETKNQIMKQEVGK